MDDENDALTELEKVAALVSAVDFEISLGGLAGFYYNSSGNQCLETVAALETIGANKAAVALLRSVQLFPNTTRVSQRDYRQEHLLDLSDEFRAIEAEYEKQDPSVWELLTSYVNENIGA